MHKHRFILASDSSFLWEEEFGHVQLFHKDEHILRGKSEYVVVYCVVLFELVLTRVSIV